MKVKISEASGPVLDYLVAKCEEVSVCNVVQSHGFVETAWDKETKWENACEIYSPTTNWSQGGPIIEREGITLRTNACINGHWVAFIDFGSSNTNVKARQSGQTPLIAAMRCFCCSELGEAAEVPDELL